MDIRMNNGNKVFPLAYPDAYSSNGARPCPIWNPTLRIEDREAEGRSRFPNAEK
jgi:hypothetical protein